MSKKTTDNYGKMVLYGTVLVIILLIWGISSLVSHFKGHDTSKDNAASTSQAAPSPKPTSKEITQHDAEVACQDEANIKLNGSNIAVISLLDYAPYFEKQDGTFDENKTPVYLLQWTGKDKDTNKKVGFSCWISGTPKNPFIQSLRADGVQLDGDIDFPSYDADGKRLN